MSERKLWNNLSKEDKSYLIRFTANIHLEQFGFYDNEVRLLQYIAMIESENESLRENVQNLEQNIADTVEYRDDAEYRINELKEELANIKKLIS